MFKLLIRKLLTMTTLDDVISYVLTTEELSDLPTIMDAITERVATEMWLVADQAAPAEAEEMPAEEPMPTEEAPAEEEALPPLSL